MTHRQFIFIFCLNLVWVAVVLGSVAESRLNDRHDWNCMRAVQP